MSFIVTAITLLLIFCTTLFFAFAYESLCTTILFLPFTRLFFVWSIDFFQFFVAFSPARHIAFALFRSIFSSVSSFSLTASDCTPKTILPFNRLSVRMSNSHIFAYVLIIFKNFSKNSSSFCTILKKLYLSNEILFLLWNILQTCFLFDPCLSAGFQLGWSYWKSVLLQDQLPWPLMLPLHLWWFSAIVMQRHPVELLAHMFSVNVRGFGGLIPATPLSAPMF